MELFPTILPMRTSMAYGGKGGKECAAEARDMPMGKGKGKDMVKGWGYETRTRTFEQVECDKKKEVVQRSDHGTHETDACDPE